MKKKVALFANGWNGENLDNFISGFYEQFAREEIDLFVFTAHTSYAQSMAIRNAEEAIYMLPDYSFFDVVIIFGSGINSETAIERILDECKAANVPVILQGYDLDGITSVIADNHNGMRMLCDHLIETHNVKDVVFIAGARDNADSNTRLNVVKDSLEAHGLKLADEDIIYANWEVNLVNSYITETYGNGKRKLPDAIMCANDQMAIFVLVFLEQIGVKLPEEVIVTGFDNLSAGRVYYPSLSSVDQSYKNQGYECARLIMEVADDRSLVKKSVVPCTISPGESCGCTNCKNESELRRNLGRQFWSNQYSTQNTQSRETLLDMCIMSNDKFEYIQGSMKKDFFVKIGEETEDFHIYVKPQYKNLKYMNVPESEANDFYYGSVMDVIGARVAGRVCDESKLETKKLILGYSATEKGNIYIFNALRVDASVAGYMVIGYSDRAFEKRKIFGFASRLDKTLKKFQRNIFEYNRTIKIQEQSNEFLRQTVEALASAVDAKDAYTHGHSARVAKYAKKIAKISGMSEEECADVYLAGLLHDVGKIGISDKIINKEGMLSPAEFAEIKKHPVLGEEILSNILVSPSLSIGAKYHHERYDGKGYPDNLKGEDIPQIARIIAVADAYDAMTSKRSYRDMIPRMYVREELVKGIGTQFDPNYATIMLHLLDEDEEYKMKENRSEEIFGADSSYEFNEYKTRATAGLRINDCLVSVKIQYEPLKDGGMPILLFYDSADARYYLDDDSLAGEMDFIEYASMGMDGDISTDFVRKMKLNTSDLKADSSCNSENVHKATIQLVKQEDHFLVKVITEDRVDEVIFALYDASRFLYFAFTGEYCNLDILEVDVADEPVSDKYIPRIADKVSYIDKRPVGDIPNIQVDGWKSKHSEIIEFTKHMEINFYTMSLPSSRRVWHCPIICLFTSDDGRIDGSNYMEVVSIRLDGEGWCENTEVTNYLTSSKDENFDNWSIWKQKNKAGVECKLSLSHKGNVVNLQVENSGLTTVNQAKLPESVEKVYCYITGDQCAITNIRIDKD